MFTARELVTLIDNKLDIASVCICRQSRLGPIIALSAVSGLQHHQRVQ